MKMAWCALLCTQVPRTHVHGHDAGASAFSQATRAGQTPNFGISPRRCSRTQTRGHAQTRNRKGKRRGRQTDSLAVRLDGSRPLRAAGTCECHRSKAESHSMWCSDPNCQKFGTPGAAGVAAAKSRRRLTTGALVRSCSAWGSCVRRGSAYTETLGGGGPPSNRPSRRTLPGRA